jgi:hypothetical protein
LLAQFGDLRWANYTSGENFRKTVARELGVAAAADVADSTAGEKIHAIDSLFILHGLTKARGSVVLMDQSESKTPLLGDVPLTA